LKYRKRRNKRKPVGQKQKFYDFVLGCNFDLSENSYNKIGGKQCLQHSKDNKIDIECAK
jgi:hypothetical protein